MHRGNKVNGKNFHLHISHWTGIGFSDYSSDEQIITYSVKIYDPTSDSRELSA